MLSAPLGLVALSDTVTVSIVGAIGAFLTGLLALKGVMVNVQNQQDQEAEVAEETDVATLAERDWLVKALRQDNVDLRIERDGIRDDCTDLRARNLELLIAAARFDTEHELESMGALHKAGWTLLCNVAIAHPAGIHIVPYGDDVDEQTWLGFKAVSYPEDVPEDRIVTDAVLAMRRRSFRIYAEDVRTSAGYEPIPPSASAV